MPTPSNNAPPTPPELPSRTHSSSCPEDLRSANSWNPEHDVLLANMNGDATTSSDAVGVSGGAIVELLTDTRSITESPQPDSPATSDRVTSESVDTEDSPSHKITDEPGEVRNGALMAVPAERHRSRCDLDAATAEHDKIVNNDGRVPINHSEYEPSMGFDNSNFRIIPMTPSSFLRPGSKFHGTQQSERQVYDVQVEIKYVDLRESFLCGYLKIQGLTEDNPTLTTYFEGEIIGSHYDFLTKHEGWGATEKIDLNHWGKFSAFRPYSKQVKKGVAVTIPNLAQRENIFMRWKERFLVPDHRVTSINGASFEGFYYICFNQKEGSVSGIYFHSRSEKFQQLELKHVQDRGCFRAVEFR